MIKLRNLIKEEEQNYDLNEILNYINKYPCEILIYRGDDKINNNFFLKKIKNRELRDTNEEDNDILEIIKKYYNYDIPNRKETMFATTSYETTKRYGKTSYILFPNECKIYFNPLYEDSFYLTRKVSEILIKIRQLNNSKKWKNLNDPRILEIIKFFNSIKKSKILIDKLNDIDYEKLLKEFNLLIDLFKPAISEHPEAEEYIYDIKIILKNFKYIKEYFEYMFQMDNRICNHERISNRLNIEMIIKGNTCLFIEVIFFHENFKWNKDNNMWELKND